MDRSIRTPVHFDQLAVALRSAGYRSSDDIVRDMARTRYQRDVALSALVKAKRQRKATKALKVRVGHLVTALRTGGVIG